MSLMPLGACAPNLVSSAMPAAEGTDKPPQPAARVIGLLGAKGGVGTTVCPLYTSDAADEYSGVETAGARRCTNNNKPNTIRE